TRWPRDWSSDVCSSDLGAEIHAEGLLQALRVEGHEAEIVAVPFKWYPPERILETMLACRLLDLTESAGTRVDRVIGLKFPAYLKIGRASCRERVENCSG